MAALCVATALVLGGQALAAHQARATKIWFAREGAPTAVSRSVPTIRAAVTSLLAGPTAVEQARGFTTSIPAGTELRDLTVARQVVTVDLAARFASGHDLSSLHERVSQLVRTLRAIPGVQAVRVRIEGGVPIGLFPGYDLGRPVLKAADSVARPPTTRDYQQLLADLGFMDQSGVTGMLDDRTATGALGFQKWAGLARVGQLDEETRAGLLRAVRPEPELRLPAIGRRIEVHLGQQVALLIENGRVVRTVHISSGAGGKTPVGSFRVYRKERYSWSVPFKVWLPWASYFTGGVAFHEFGSVPTYAASHGCIRVNHYDAQLLYAFATIGTPVRVMDERA